MRCTSSQRRLGSLRDGAGQEPTEAPACAGATGLVAWYKGGVMGRSLGLGCTTYAILSFAMFGSFFQPIMLLVFYPAELAGLHWRWIVAGGFAVGTLAFFIPARWSYFRVPAFVAVGMLGPLFVVAVYANDMTAQALKAFGADRSTQQGFVKSLRHMTDEPKFHLHAIALKRCVPYAWSYRSLDFYRIPARAAINVLPRAWLAECPAIRAEALR